MPWSSLKQLWKCFRNKRLWHLVGPAGLRWLYSEGFSGSQAGFKQNTSGICRGVRLRLWSGPDFAACSWFGTENYRLQLKRDFWGSNSFWALSFLSVAAVYLLNICPVDSFFMANLRLTMKQGWDSIILLHVHLSALIWKHYAIWILEPQSHLIQLLGLMMNSVVTSCHSRFTYKGQKNRYAQECCQAQSVHVLWVE